MKGNGSRSGEVCFPGGHIEPGETPQIAAERETLEEVGLDLTDNKNFTLIGRMNDRITFDNMLLHSFVYLQICNDTPKITLEDNELVDVGWVDMDFYRDCQSTDIVKYTSITTISKSRRLRNKFVRFLWGFIQVPYVDLPIKTSKFLLWGLTLELSSELLVLLNSKSPIPTIKQANNPIPFFIAQYTNTFLTAFLTTTILAGVATYYYYF
eukprot:gene7970-9803_t